MNRYLNNLLGSGVILVLILVAGCREAPAEAGAPVAPVRPVKLHTVEGGVGESLRRFPAEVKATKRSELAFRVPGELLELPVQEGKKVEQGQLLARLDPRDYQLVVDQRRAQYRLAKAQFERFQTMLERKLVSVAQYDGYKAELDVVAASLRQAELDLSYTELRAPYAGVISQRLLENFHSVQAKQPVLVLQSASQIDVVFQVPESLAARARREQARDYRPLVVFDAAPGREYPAQFREMTTEADPQTRSYSVTLSLSMPQELKLYPGMTAEVRVDLRQVLKVDSSYPLVPVEALFSDDASPLASDLRDVWKVDPVAMTVSRQAVRIGGLSARGVEVVEGLGAGDLVVAAGVRHLKEGQPVRAWTRERGL